MVLYIRPARISTFSGHLARLGDISSGLLGNLNFEGTGLCLCLTFVRARPVRRLWPLRDGDCDGMSHRPFYTSRFSIIVARCLILLIVIRTSPSKTSGQVTYLSSFASCRVSSVLDKSWAEVTHSVSEPYHRLGHDWATPILVTSRGESA